MLLLSSADFSNQFFQNILSGPLSKCQTNWIHIRHDILSGLTGFKLFTSQLVAYFRQGKERTFICSNTVKPLKQPLKKKTEIGFQDQLSLNAGQKYCRMLQESILQYFRPALSYHLSGEVGAVKPV